MKNSIILKLACFFTFCNPYLVLGQQIVVDPASSGEGVNILALEQTPSTGNFLHLGWKSDILERAVMVRTDFAGIFQSGLLFDYGTRFDASTLHGDNVKVVGQYNDNALIVKFSDAGVVLWKKSFGVPSVTLAFQDVVVSTADDIYVAGIEMIGGVGREMIFKLNSSGDIIWTRKLRDITTTRFTSRIFLRGDSLLVFGSNQALTSSDITATIYRQSDGDFVNQVVYRIDASQERFLDAVPFQGGFVFSFNTLPSLTPVLARVNSGLGLVGSPQSMWSSSIGESFSGAELATDDTKVFVSGSVMGMSYKSSSVVVLNSTLTIPVWAKRVTHGTLSEPVPLSMSSRVLSNSSVAFLSNKWSTGNSITTVLLPNGTATWNCEALIDLSDVAMSNAPVMNTVNVTQVVVDINGVVSGRPPTYIPYLSPTDACLSPLSAELTSLDAKQVKETNVLVWQTASENDNSHFNVMRSLDGLSWETIGRVAGSGNSQQLRDYDFVDELPFEGQNFYKLMQVDFNGAFKYSDVVSVLYEGALGFTIFPNPLISGQNLNLRGEFTSLEVVDQLGRTIFKEGSNINQLTLSVGPGTYNVVAYGANGSRTNAKLVIQ